LRRLARERGAALLLGASRSLPGKDGRTMVFSSAFLFPADGAEPLVYDKRILLPYIERIPAWVTPFLASPWQGSFTPGVSPSQVRSSSPLPTGSDGFDYSTPPVFEVKGWRIAPLLCLEAIYPSVAASRAAAGADLLVNLSNDSWFDRGAGPEQHFALAALASAETRRPMVRVATTGVSALVTEDGLLSWRLPVRTSAVALLDVVPPRRDSLFVRGGRIGFALFVLLLAAAAALLPALLGREGWGSSAPAPQRDDR
ncbi:MAG: nitrilase-related carbon-nitrogen hydrolase, partial [Candidatus Binatia bacterium]